MKLFIQKIQILIIWVVAICLLRIYATPAAHEASAVEVKKINDELFGDCYSLRNDEVEVVVSPRAGRIVFYGFAGGKNQLWINPAAVEYKEKIGNWVNWGGDKVWIWPQNDWSRTIGRGWPPPNQADGKAWQVDILSHNGINYLSLSSAPVSAYGIKIIRSISLAAKGTELTVETQFIPLPGKTISSKLDFAVWSISQVPLSKKIYARILPDIKTPMLHPMQGSKPWTEFKPLGNGYVLRLTRKGDDWFKGGMDADLLAVETNNIFMVQKIMPTPNLAAGQFQAGERAQICSSPDNCECYPANLPPYLELEFTSPIVPLSETASHILTIKWALYKLEELDEKNDEGIAKWIERL